MKFDPNTPNPFEDSDFAWSLGHELGAKAKEISLRNDILERIQAVMFHGKVINWSELAFGRGWVSESIEKVLGWPPRCMSAHHVIKCINKEDLRQLDTVKVDLLPVYFQAHFRICHANGEWVKMFTHCHITPSSIYGLMLPASANL